METRIGTLKKMRTAADVTVQYSLPLGEAQVPLNPLLGHTIRFKYTGRIFCIHCGKATKTSFAQGYCYRCMQTLAQTDMCIVRPETCHHHLGTCREPEWGTAHCFIEHTVYLANSSGIKVGITRSHQMLTRWMDQGAIQALPIVKVKTRLESGQVESRLSKILPDKTNWRLMLKGQGDFIDLQAQRDEVFATWAADLPGERLTNHEEYRFNYPVIAYPEKPVSLNLEKEPEVKGTLLGIKGQYLLISTGVINIRKYAGYELEWESDAGGAATPTADIAALGTKVAEKTTRIAKTSGSVGEQTSLF